MRFGEEGGQGGELTGGADFVSRITDKGLVLAVHFGHWQGSVHVDRPPLTRNDRANGANRVLDGTLFLLRPPPEEGGFLLLLIVQKEGPPPLCTLLDGSRLG